MQQFRAQQLVEELLASVVPWIRTVPTLAWANHAYLFVKASCSTAWTIVKIVTIVLVNLNAIEFMLNAMQIARAAQIARKAAMIVNILFASVQEPFTTHHFSYFKLKVWLKTPTSPHSEYLQARKCARFNRFRRECQHKAQIRHAWGYRSLPIMFNHAAWSTLHFRWTYRATPNQCSWCRHEFLLFFEFIIQT